MNQPADTNFNEQTSEQENYFQASYGGNMRPDETNYIKRQVDALIAFAGLTKDQRILEIGCGMGRYTFELLRQGYQVEGLDLTRFLLDELERLNPGFDVTLHCANALEPPEALLGQFDAVIGFFALHHFPALKSSFSAAARLCRPGGVIAFLEPNPFNPLYYIQIPCTPGMSFKEERGLFSMRKKPVFAAMTEAGLLDPRSGTLGWFPPFVVNKSWGPGLEDFLIKLSPRACLPFIQFRADVPS